MSLSSIPIRAKIATVASNLWVLCMSRKAMTAAAPPSTATATPGSGGRNQNHRPHAKLPQIRSQETAALAQIRCMRDSTGPELPRVSMPKSLPRRPRDVHGKWRRKPDRCIFKGCGIVHTRPGFCGMPIRSKFQEPPYAASRTSTIICLPRAASAAWICTAFVACETGGRALPERLTPRSGAMLFRRPVPTACAVGYVLSLLRSFPQHSHD